MFSYRLPLSCNPSSPRSLTYLLPRSWIPVLPCFLISSFPYFLAPSVPHSRCLDSTLPCFLCSSSPNSFAPGSSLTQCLSVHMTLKRGVLFRYCAIYQFNAKFRPKMFFMINSMGHGFAVVPPFRIQVKDPGARVSVFSPRCAWRKLLHP